MHGTTMKKTLHLVGCNLEFYYDSRTYEYQKCFILSAVKYVEQQYRQRTAVLPWRRFLHSSLHTERQT